MQATATPRDDALEAATEEGREAAPPNHVSDYHKALQQAQEALGAVKLVDCARMQRRLEALRRLYNSVIILDRAADGRGDAQRLCGHAVANADLSPSEIRLVDPWVRYSPTNPKLSSNST